MAKKERFAESVRSMMPIGSLRSSISPASIVGLLILFLLTLQVLPVIELFNINRHSLAVVRLMTSEIFTQENTIPLSGQIEDVRFSTAANSPQFAYLSGLVSLHSGRPSDAVQVLGKVDCGIRTVLCDWLIFQALAISGEEVRASSVLQEMKMDTNALVSLARGLNQKEDVAAIRLLASQALRQGQGSIATRQWLGLWSIANSNPRQAIEIIEPIISPEDHYLWSQLGWAYYILGDYAKAAKAFERSVTLRPEDPFYQLRLAQAYQARNGQGDQEQARTLLEDLVSKGVGVSAEVWFTLGWNYYISNRSADAVSAFEKAVGMEPNNSYYQMRLAQALVLRSEGNDRVRAIALLQKAVAQSPNLTEAANLLRSLTSPGQ